MDIQYTDHAFKQLAKINQGDKKTALKIIDKIEKYAENPEGKFDIKHLKGNFGDRLRIRVGNYRIIFKVENNIMKISTISHRQETYND